MNKQITAEDYRAIAAWGNQLRSFQYYIKNQQEKALTDNAPINSIYFSTDQQRWVTSDEIASDVLRTIIQEAE